MRIALSEFILKSSEERKSHLDLKSLCDEYGCTHSDYRAVLAWYLNTTCDRMGRKVGICCHACGNRKCGNPLHLYWGSQKENMQDLIEHQPDLHLRIRDKILEKNPNHYKEMSSKRSKKTPDKHCGDAAVQ